MKKGTKKVLSVSMAAMMALSVVGCGAQEPAETKAAAPAETKAAESAEAPAAAAPEGTVEIEFWNSYAGDVATQIEKMVAEFNESQDAVHVNITYAGEYREVLAKLQATEKSNHPDIFMQDMENGFQVFADPAELYVPIQRFIDAEGDDFAMPTYLGCLTSSYSDADGNLLALPFGNSMAGFWYNADMFKELGLDPQVELGSYERILEVSRQLKAKGIEYPYYQHPSSSFISMAMTAQGIPYMDNNNGKDGVPTKSLFGEVGSDCYNATVSFFDFLQTMTKEELMVPYGASANDGRAMWANGQVAIYDHFISGFTTCRDAVAGNFEFGWRGVGTVDDVPAVGTGATGACLFISNKGDAVKENAAWECLKYLASPENVVEFAKSSGYLPVTSEGIETEEYQTFIKEEFPTAQYAIDLQASTPENVYNAWIPMFTDYHALCNEYYGYACTHLDETPEQVAEKFAAAVDECIELYRLQYGLN